MCIRDRYWFDPNQNNDGTNKPFKTVAGTSFDDSSATKTVVVDLGATGVSPSFFSAFHVHTGATGAAGAVSIEQAWLTDTLPDLSDGEETTTNTPEPTQAPTCLLYTPDAADDLLSVELGVPLVIKKKKNDHVK